MRFSLIIHFLLLELLDSFLLLNFKHSLNNLCQYIIRIDKFFELYSGCKLNKSYEICDKVRNTKYFQVRKKYITLVKQQGETRFNVTGVANKDKHRRNHWGKTYWIHFQLLLKVK